MCAYVFAQKHLHFARIEENVGKAKVGKAMETSSLVWVRNWGKKGRVKEGFALISEGR